MGKQKGDAHAAFAFAPVCMAHLPKPPSSPARSLPLSFPVTRPFPCAFRHPQFPVGSALLIPSFTVPFSCSCLLHSRVFTLLPSLSYLHYVSFALLFTFLPALSCPHFRAIFSSFAFSTFLVSFSWLHSPAFVFRRLHRPSPSALRFSCI